MHTLREFLTISTTIDDKVKIFHRSLAVNSLIYMWRNLLYFRSKFLLNPIPVESAQDIKSI